MNIDLDIVGTLIINMTIVCSRGVVAINFKVCAVIYIVNSIYIRRLGVVVIMYTISVTNCALSYIVGMNISLDVNSIDIKAYGLVSAAMEGCIAGVDIIAAIIAYIWEAAITVFLRSLVRAVDCADIIVVWSHNVVWESIHVPDRYIC